MKLGILTSSRADYSIYLPLLKALREDQKHSIDIIAFGSHLSHQRDGIKKIEADGFEVKYQIKTSPDKDSPLAISHSMGITMENFGSFWNSSSFDLVFCLGDRYEMFAACASTVPFRIKLAHLHGGETTRGAIDDVFRHAITHMSHLHFTAAEPYRKRVIELTGSPDHVYNVGALGIDNLSSLDLWSVEEFNRQFGIDLSIPTILITFHPETDAFNKNGEYVNELIMALENIHGYQFVITMPNDDTSNQVIRTRLTEFIDRTENAVGLESMGTMGYLSCMKHCSFMLGNTSSGFTEASYFPKKVINLGERQTGRIVTENIISCEIEHSAIVAAVERLSQIKLTSKIDLYGTGNAARNILAVLNQLQ